MTEDETWKKRFQLFAVLRLAGLAFFLLGIAIAYSDLLRPGGFPLLGGLVAIFGALEAVFIPRILKRSWDRK